MRKMSRRVVITGHSAITPIGRTRKEILRNLVEGNSGVKKIRDDGKLDIELVIDTFQNLDALKSKIESEHQLPEIKVGEMKGVRAEV